MLNKIIYVDDEMLNLQLFQINFRAKYDVVIANDGYKALDLLEANTEAEIVISDMRMPGMNGVEFINKAKAKYPDKKYFILTGFDITEEIKEALDSGLILKHFRKPFNIQEIENTISEYLCAE